MDPMAHSNVVMAGLMALATLGAALVGYFLMEGILALRTMRQSRRTRRLSHQQSQAPFSP